MAHVLVVGGTGMLKKVSLFLASYDNIVSVVAKSKEDFDQLREESKGLTGAINPISIDYHELDMLSTTIEESIQKFGPVTLAVNWMHDQSQRIADVIATILNATSPICRYFQILPGTEIGTEIGLEQQKQRENPFRHLERVLYRIIVLGFTKEKGTTRWLTNDEISEGVIEALRDDAHDAVIGLVEPWEERPQSA